MCNRSNSNHTFHIILSMMCGFRYPNILQSILHQFNEESISKMASSFAFTSLLWISEYNPASSDIRRGYQDRQIEGIIFMMLKKSFPWMPLLMSVVEPDHNYKFPKVNITWLSPSETGTYWPYLIKLFDMSPSKSHGIA